jgi:hypothetical protein
MRSLLLPVLSLTLLSASYASPIGRPQQLAAQSNFELCGQLGPAATSVVTDMESAISARVFGGFAGFIALTRIDGLMRYLDPQWMAAVRAAGRRPLMAASHRPDAGPAAN